MCLLVVLKKHWEHIKRSEFFFKKKKEEKLAVHLKLQTLLKANSDHLVANLSLWLMCK